MWNRPKIDIELKEDETPFHGQPYKIPQMIFKTVKTEVQMLVDIGVFLPNPQLEWVAPLFAIPKKTG